MQERIQQLLLKLQELSSDKRRKSAVDIDLMLDYVRVIYADLLELKKNTPVLHTEQVIISQPEQNAAPANETLPTDESKTESPQAIQQNIEKLEKDSSSAIAFEPPHPNLNEEDRVATPEPIVEEKPEPPAPEPVIIPPPVAKPKYDVRNVIGLNDKYLFLNELFNNHKSDYENLLDKINAMQSFEEAQNWVKEQALTKSIWDEDNAIVQDFVSILKKHFSLIR